MSHLGPVMAFLWDKETGGASVSSACSGQELLEHAELLWEGADVQGSARGVEDTK